MLMGLLAFQKENLFNLATLNNFSFKDIHCCRSSSRGQLCSFLGISGPAQWGGGCLLLFCFVFSCGAFPERNWKGARNWGTAAPWPLPASHSGLQRGQEWTQGHHQSPHCTEHTRAFAVSVKAGPQTVFIYGLFSEHTHDLITPLGDCALAAKTKYRPVKL